MEFAIIAEVFDHIDYIVVVMLLKDTDFTHHSLAYMCILIFTLLELLDSDDATGFSLLRLVDFAVGALTNHL